MGIAVGPDRHPHRMAADGHAGDDGVVGRADQRCRVEQLKRDEWSRRGTAVQRHRDRLVEHDRHDVVART